MRSIKRRKRTTAEAVEDVSSSLKRRKRKDRISVEFLGSGSTTLNLALSGKGPSGGWARGRVVNIVGDGSSGKTLLALELLFWCYKHIKDIKSAIYPKVKEVILVYNNCEGVMDFPLEKMYGKEFVSSVEWVCTKTIEKMGRDYMRRIKNLKKGQFLIYIIDSWDAIGSKAGQDRMEESIEKDSELKGSYNTEKQLYASKDFFPYISGKMESNSKDATLVIISQVRTKIGVTFGKKTYRAGGKALDFYTHQVAWIREVEKLTKTKKKQKRVYGIRSHVKVERSKVAKPFRESEFTILYDYGLDDISSMVDYLWGKKKIRYDGKVFKTREKFIKYIEENNLETRLAIETEEAWNKVEKAFEKDVTKRKKRF